TPRGIQGLGGPSANHHCSMRYHGRARRYVRTRRVEHRRHAVPHHPRASPRTPHPAVPWDKQPTARVIRRPAPGIRRHPGVAEARIPHPGTVHERIPAETSKVWLPAHAVTGHVVVAAVVI